MYRAFSGANGWYVAWEREDGYHCQPPSWDSSAHMQEEAARREARRLNTEVETEEANNG